jgi:cob(I)alamin adenosyltransferase
MHDEGQHLEDYVIIYLNRLSDYLFVLSRFILLKNKGIETIWEGK